MDFLRQLAPWTVLILMQMAPVCQTQGQQPPVIVAINDRVQYFRPGNDEIQFNCTATGLPDPVYSWTRNRNPIQTGNGVFIDNDGAILRLETPDESGQADYACAASNVVGTSISDVFQLQFAYLRTFPTDTTVPTLTPTIGDYHQIVCKDKPESLPSPTYEWMKGEPAILGLNGRIAVDQSGTLHFANIMASDVTSGKNYGCRVENKILSQTSTGQNLAMVPLAGTASHRKPILRFKTTVAPMAAIVGRTYELQCVFSGYPTPTVTWTTPGSRPISGYRRLDDFDRKLIFTSVQETDDGTYRCTGRNTQSTSKTLNIQVASEPLWVKKLTHVTVAKGQTAVLHCETRTAHNRYPPNRPDWLSNGRTMSIAGNPRYTFNAAFTTLTITDAQKADRRSIQCKVTNDIGYITGAAFINVLDNIVPTVTPNNQTVDVGEIVYLQAQAVGDPIETLRYRWFYRDRTIDSQTFFPSVYVKADNTLVVNASTMTAKDLKQWTGIYFVDISNSVETVRLSATVLMPGETIVSEIVAKAGVDWMLIGIIIGVAVVALVVIIVIIMLRRNRGEIYKVDDKERSVGRDPIKELENEGFQDLSRADDLDDEGGEARTRPPTEMKPMLPRESDDGPNQTTEDASFIGKPENTESQRPTESSF